MSKGKTTATAKTALAVLLATGSLGLAAQASADTGLYVGGSVGQSDIDIDLGGASLDEDDTAWKGFVGFNFDLLVIDLAIEGSYVDFGEVSISGPGGSASLSSDGYTAFGLVGLDFGVVGVFAKAGMARLDGDLRANLVGVGSFSDSDTSTDPAYGFGARIYFGSMELRGEYEYFDIDVEGADSSDFSMLSAGLVWTF